MLPCEYFRRGVVLVLVSLGSSLLTHAYLQGNYLSILTPLFFIFLILIALYRSRLEVFITAILVSTAYFGYQWYLLPVFTKESVSLVLGNTFLFLTSGFAANLLFEWLKYALPRMEKLDLIDKETGIWNAIQTKKLLKIEGEKRRRYGSVSSFLLLSFSDNLDKKALVLCRRIVKLFRHNIRLVDEIGRLSETKFVIILPETSTNDAEHLKKRLDKLAKNLLSSEKEVSLEFKIQVFDSPDELLKEVV